MVLGIYYLILTATLQSGLCCYLFCVPEEIEAQGLNNLMRSPSRLSWDLKLAVYFHSLFFLLLGDTSD
jgi:hypothetical protein